MQLLTWCTEDANKKECDQAEQLRLCRRMKGLTLFAGGAYEEEYEEAAPQRKELFYTEGTAALKQARLQIAHFSLDRAATRLAGAKRKRESPDEDEEAEQKDTIALMSTVSSTVKCERELHATCNLCMKISEEMLLLNKLEPSDA